MSIVQTVTNALAIIGIAAIVEQVVQHTLAHRFSWLKALYSKLYMNAVKKLNMKADIAKAVSAVTAAIKAGKVELAKVVATVEGKE